MIPRGRRGASLLVVAGLVTACIAGGAGSAGAVTKLDAAQAAEAALGKAVARLSVAVASAAVADANAASTLASLTSQQVVAEQQLDAARASAAQLLQNNGADVRSLYESADRFGFLGVLLAGGSPQELLDRVRVSAALAAGDRANVVTAAGTTGEARAAARSLADAADAQLSIAAAAAHRAAGLGAELRSATVLLARADAVTRHLRTLAEQAARAAAVRKLAAARALQAQLAATAAAAADTGGPALPAGRVPTAYRAAILRAGSGCPPTLSAALLAGQLQAESGWNPTAVSSSGALGLAQFLPGTWATRGVDGDGDGTADPMDPLDAIASAARYDCAIARTVTMVPGDPTDNMLAGYNAGPGAVLAAGGVPADAGVQAYVQRIRQLALAFLGGGFGT